MKSRNKLQNRRRKAAEQQGWQCYYCYQPMWDTDPKIFSAHFQISDQAAWYFRCTAEHLQARCDGGRDTEENIVAACQFCNGNRHKKKRPKDAEPYARYVRSRMKQGRWHSVRLKLRP